MGRKNVLLLGSGGREHAMAWKLGQSPLLNQLYIAPGNPGTEQHGINLELDLADFGMIEQAVKEFDINLVVVGPEQPLVEGITDYLEENNILVFGPSKSAAQLEGSKSFAKAFMKERGIPTADYQTFTMDQFDDARSYINNAGRYPVVLKADGLAAGKGVFICESLQQAEKRLDQLASDQKLKDAASTLVVEEFMEGEEASVFVLCDGNTGKVIHNAQDHKRIGEGDTGLNTGGMGAYAPAPLLTEKLKDRIHREITIPTLEGMKRSGDPYRGILYIGLMITNEGPKVVEYNCRFGDPECQVILPPLKSDLLKLMLAACDQTLEKEQIEISDKFYCSVVLASGGYPTAYKKGMEIMGLEKVDKDALLFHSGTKRVKDKILTSGGRVLNIVGSGNTLTEAIEHSYKNVKQISFKDSYYRSDIGQKGLQKVD